LRVKIGYYEIGTSSEIGHTVFSLTFKKCKNLNNGPFNMYQAFS